jgi:hypothetical protein
MTTVTATAPRRDAATQIRYDLPTWIDGHQVFGDDRFDVCYPYTGAAARFEVTPCVWGKAPVARVAWLT